MGKKRKHSATETVPEVHKEETAPERPQRTLLGFKNKDEQEKEEDQQLVVKGGSLFFRNKEKVLVTCSRRINFR